MQLHKNRHCPYQSFTFSKDVICFSSIRHISLIEATILSWFGISMHNLIFTRNMFNSNWEGFTDKPDYFVTNNNNMDQKKMIAVWERNLWKFWPKLPQEHIQMFWLTTLHKIKISLLFSNQHAKFRSFKWHNSPSKTSKKRQWIFQNSIPLNLHRFLLD